MRALALLLLLAACHSPAPIVSPPPSQSRARAEPVAEPAIVIAPEAETEAPSEQDLLPQQARPTLRATIEVDPETLPLAAWGPPRKDSWLSFFHGADGTRRFHVEGVSFAEVHVNGFVGFTGELDGFANDAWPECGPGKPSAPATWRGISVVGWTDASVSIAMNRGVLDGVACVARPTATLVGRAVAIVPRFVYAVRFDHFVYVIMPGASLAVASDDRAGHGSFTAIVLSLESHRERAAAVRISAFGLAQWRGMPSLEASLLAPDLVEDPSTSPLVVVEVRARDDRSVLAVSLATVAEGLATADFVDAVRARAKR